MADRMSQLRDLFPHAAPRDLRATLVRCRGDLQSTIAELLEKPQRINGLKISASVQFLPEWSTRLFSSSTFDEFVVPRFGIRELVAFSAVCSQVNAILEEPLWQAKVAALPGKLGRISLAQNHAIRKILAADESFSLFESGPRPVQIHWEKLSMLNQWHILQWVFPTPTSDDSVLKVLHPERKERTGEPVVASMLGHAAAASGSLQLKACHVFYITTEGFVDSELNGIYFLDGNILVGGFKTYWKRCKQDNAFLGPNVYTKKSPDRVFMYWQWQQKRWAIAKQQECPLEHGTDSLDRVQAGETLGLAYHHPTDMTRWFECIGMRDETSMQATWEERSVLVRAHRQVADHLLGVSSATILNSTRSL